MAKDKKGSITIKVLAVLIAIIMWFYVMSDINPVISREFNNIKVEFKHTEAVQESNLYVKGPKQVEVSVEVSGRREDILKITQEDINSYVDLRGMTEGDIRVPINVNSSIDKIEIKNYKPKEAIFTIEGIISTEKQVELEPTGTVANGYEMGTEQLKPNIVIIRGPKSFVNSIDKVVAAVDVTNVRETINVNVPYKILDDRGIEVGFVTKEPETIEVTVPVYKVKNVNITPQPVGQLLEGYMITSIRTRPQSIKIKGSIADVNAIKTIRTTPIDISSFTENNTVVAELIIPEGILLSNPNETLEVYIEVEPIVEKTFEYTVKDVTIIDKNENLQLDYSESSSKVTINIRGIESVMDEITRRDITPYMDLKDLEEGEHDLEIKALIEEGVEIVSISPETIKVVLSQLLEEELENPEENN